MVMDMAMAAAENMVMANRLIDIHTHILPGLDDGAEKWKDALAMARMSVKAGVGVVLATSHSRERGRESAEYLVRYVRTLNRFRSLLAEYQIPLQIGAGMEIMADGHVAERLDAGEVLTLNKTRYALVEFELDSPVQFIYRELDRLLDRGYVPVVAHPERYHCITRSVEDAAIWTEMGALLQINKGSILGGFGKEIQTNADQLLRMGIVYALASDAHRPYIRTPDIRELIEVLHTDYGENAVKMLLHDNPAAILLGK